MPTNEADVIVAIVCRTAASGSRSAGRSVGEAVQVAELEEEHVGEQDAARRWNVEIARRSSRSAAVRVSGIVEFYRYRQSVQVRHRLPRNGQFY
jgi:hypothetical protein